MRTHRHRRRGQAITEAALIFPLLLVLVMGIFEYGKFLESQQTIITIVRSGARYASVYPTAWTNAPSASLKTIEGVMQLEGGSLNLQNTDAQITIGYFDCGSTATPAKCTDAAQNITPTLCAQWTQASNALVYKNGYNANASGYNSAYTGCVVAGDLIRVTINYPYSPVTPVLSAFHFNANLTESFTVAEML